MTPLAATAAAIALLAGILAGMVWPASAMARDMAAPASAQDAPIAMLVDTGNSQILFEREADRRFVPASITKVMTLYTAFEQIDEGTLDPERVITMPENVWRDWRGRGSTMWINLGDNVPARDLLLGIANVSANDASVLLAQAQAGSVENWLDAMNANARDLGMANSHFGTPNGWPDAGATFTTARDLVTLAGAMVNRHPDKFAYYIGRPGLTYGGIEQANRDPMIGRVAGADGIKTGYTNEAGFGYLGTAMRDGRRLVLVVAGSPRSRARARAARDLVEWGFGAFERKTLFKAGEIVATARVQAGSERRVGLSAPRDIYINLPQGNGAGHGAGNGAQIGSGELDGVRATLRYDGPVRAPILRGEVIAHLVIEVPGMAPTRIALEASSSVEEAGFFTRFADGLAGWGNGVIGWFG